MNTEYLKEAAKAAGVTVTIKLGLHAFHLYARETVDQMTFELSEVLLYAEVEGATFNVLKKTVEEMTERLHYAIQMTCI